MTPAPEDRAVRAARSGAAVGAAVLVALGAHLSGGGRPPAPMLVVAVLALAWPVGLLLVGRRPSLLRRAAVVGVAQAMLHGVFAIGGDAVGVVPTPTSPHGGMAGMHALVLPTASAGEPMQHGGAMPWMHVLAWALTVAAWRWGGAALTRLRTRLAVRRLLALLTPVDPGSAASCPPRGRAHVPHPALLLAAHRDRGPPCPA